MKDRRTESECLRMKQKKRGRRGGQESIADMYSEGGWVHVVCQGRALVKGTYYLRELTLRRFYCNHGRLDLGIDPRLEESLALNVRDQTAIAEFGLADNPSMGRQAQLVICQDPQEYRDHFVRNGHQCVRSRSKAGLGFAFEYHSTDIWISHIINSTNFVRWY